jgi:hypothetical protein
MKKNLIEDNIKKLITIGNKLLAPGFEFKYEDLKLSTLKNLVNKYNNFIDKKNIYDTKVENLNKLTQNKYKSIDKYNMLVDEIKKKDTQNQLKIQLGGHQNSLGGHQNPQVGGGIITKYEFDKEYNEKSLNEKLNDLDNLQKEIARVNTENFTNDIKKAKMDYVKAIKEYKEVLENLLPSDNNGVPTFNQLLSDFNRTLTELGKYTKDPNKYGELQKINLNSDMLKELDDLTKKIEAKTTSKTLLVPGNPAAEIQSLKSEKAKKDKEITSLQKDIRILKKTVQDYKNSIKNKSGTGVVPTLSSAVRFSKVGDLLGIPSTSLIDTLKAKKISTGTSSASDSDFFKLSKTFIGQQQQMAQLTDEHLESLTELFTSEFILDLKRKKAADVLIFLYKFNKTKPAQLVKAAMDTKHIEKFIEYLRFLKGQNSQSLIAHLYSNLSMKYPNTADFDSLCKLIKYFILNDESGFSKEKNSDIISLYKLLNEKLSAESLTYINNGKFLKTAATQVSASTGVQSSATEDLKENYFKTELEASFRFLTSDKLSGTFKDKIDAINEFVDKIKGLLGNKDKLPTKLKSVFKSAGNNTKVSIYQGNKISTGKNIFNLSLEEILEKLVRGADTSNNGIIFRFFNNVVATNPILNETEFKKYIPNISGLDLINDLQSLLTEIKTYRLATAPPASVAVSGTP